VGRRRSAEIGLIQIAPELIWITIAGQGSRFLYSIIEETDFDHRSLGTSVRRSRYRVLDGECAMRKIACESCPVRASSIIRDLPLAELDHFRACGSSAIYRKRQVVFHEESPATGLYLVCSGAVKLYQSDRFGREHILHVCGPGEVLGELPSGDETPYSASAEALVDSQLCYLPRESLASFIQKHPMTGVHLIGALSRALGSARRKVRALALKRAESRMAGLLLELVESTGTLDADGSRRLTIPYSRRELADMIGVAPETAIRMLARLKDRDIIATEQRELVIRDSEKLARLANHDAVTAA
jgi:CRP/FNR family transcriptional regulator